MRFNPNFFKQVRLVLPIILLTTGQIFSAVSGKVINESGQPIIGANITANLDGIGSTTDKDGMFSIAHDSITSITISSIGYKSMMLLVSDLSGEIILERRYYPGQNIIVSADRAELGITPIAFDNISKADIERDYTVGEFPLLLKSTPNLHSYSDGGAALGYSYIRIRGFDDKRIVTYINGVPLNDPEDHATYFVDLPDFPANVSDIQIQRGVGNSLYGDASFGGSINIVTSAFDSPRMTTLTSGYGEYTSDGNSIGSIYKQSLSYSSGLVNGQYSFNGRFSKQKTDGYKHNSWYEGWAYYFSVGRIDPKMTTEFYVYGGPMKMHLAYWGAPRTETKVDRRYNPLTYSNETDNFNQPHYHLHNVYKLSDNATLSNTFYYIRGKGYYEQLKNNRLFSNYNLDPSVIEIDPSSPTNQPYETGDLVRQQWVKKSQYGWNPRLDIKHNKGSHTIGGSIYLFESSHWGEMVWAEHLNGLTQPHLKYYQYYGDKVVGSFFIQEYYKLNEHLSTQLTAQLRYQQYKLDSKAIGAFVGYDYNTDWLFFSPRIGINYRVNNATSLYANISVASRTPSDIAIYDANDPEVVPSLDASGDPTRRTERVYDFELGLNRISEKHEASINLFYMDFNDEIIIFDGINENGIANTTNADRSVHAGVELSAAVIVADGLSLSGNLAYNYNRIKEYKDTLIDIYSNDWSIVRDTVIDFSDKTIPAFPDILANLRLDYTVKNFQTSLGFKYIGEQFPELFNIDSLAIEPATVVNLSASYIFENVFSNSNLTISFRVDNLFDKIYETSGYGWTYGQDNSSGQAGLIHEAEYFVAPERSFYGQLKLDLF